MVGEVTVGCCACGRRRVGEGMSSLAEVADVGGVDAVVKFNCLCLGILE